MKNKIQLADNAYLRHFELSDAKEIFDLIQSNKDYLCKFLQWPRYVKELADSEGFIKRTHELLEKDIHTFAVVFEDKIAGVISFNDFNKANKRAPIGYWIGESFQGNGLVTMAVKALIDFGFNELGLNRIEIHCATENTPSQKVPERLGFTFEGITRSAEIIGDEVLDHRTYSLIRSDLN